MNIIPDTGRWNEISSVMNDNFALIENTLQHLSDVSLNKGVHASLADLQAAHPYPSVGSFAYVGTTSPYAIYVRADKSASWVDSGNKGEPKSTDYSQAPVATTSNSGFMTPAQVAKLNSLQETIQSHSQTIPALSNNLGTLQRSVTSLNSKQTNMEEQLGEVENSIEDIEQYRETWNLFSQSFINLCVVASTEEAEDAAIQLAGNPTVRWIVYQTQRGDNGFIENRYASGGNTLQFRWLNFNQAVRQVTYKSNPYSATDWKDLTYMSRVNQLNYDDATDIISFQEAIGRRPVGGVQIPVATTTKNGLLSKEHFINVYKIPAILETLNNKVSKDEEVDELTAGFAKNLVGRGDATESLIGFRQTAGVDSITDGAAHIKRLKGYSIVWNQRALTPKLSHSNKYNSDNYRAYNATLLSSVDTTHKYLAIFRVVCTASDNSTPRLDVHLYAGTAIGYMEQAFTFAGKTNEYGAKFFTINDNAYRYFGYFVRQGDEKVTNDISWDATIQVHDLTLMFGAGNEPTTLEDFYAKTPSLINTDHSDGVVLSSNSNVLKTVGFNAWDERWEVGGLSSGQPTSTNNQIRSKNFMRCLPNTQYYGTIKDTSAGETVHIAFFDKEYNHLANNNITNKVVTSPNGTAYFKIYTSHTNPYGNVYRHDICINISHSGYRNGEYEPYNEFIRPIDLSVIKDNNGAVLFPNGLCRAGSVFDEITANKAIKKVERVDLGSLTWLTATTSTGKTRMVSNSLTNIKRVVNSNQKGNVICQKYATYSADDVYLEKVAVSVDTEGHYALSIYDPSYTSASTFQNAMRGVILYYELETPIEIDLEDPINLDFEVSDFGTEEARDGNMMPFCADIVYQFNAVDMIRALYANAGDAEATSVKGILNFGRVSASGVAENLAAQYAANPEIVLMMWDTDDDKQGVVRQVYSRFGTYQYLTLDRREYVRSFSPDGSRVGPWREITGAQLIHKLVYNQGSRLLSFYDPIQETNFGGITLPEASTSCAGLMSTGAQTFAGEKTFNDHIKISSKTVIAKNIDPGELKVLHNNSSKGFIIRTKNTSDSILPLELLTTNGSSSYQYNFPAKNGTVALLTDVQALEAQITALTQQLTALTQTLNAE